MLVTSYKEASNTSILLGTIRVYPVILTTELSSLLCLTVKQDMNFMGCQLLTEIPTMEHTLIEGLDTDPLGNAVTSLTMYSPHEKNIITIWCVKIGEYEYIKKEYVKLCLQYASLK